MLLILTGIGMGCKYAVTTPELRISRVNVRGTRLLDETAVKTEVWRTIKSDNGLFGRYQNILTFSKTRILTNLKNHPEIKSVRIGRLLPRAVMVQVEEHKPCATVTNGQVFWLVEKNGLLFHQVHSVPSFTPAIILPPGTPVKLGQMAAGSGIAPALKCIGLWNGLVTDRKSRVSKISVDPVGNLCLNIGSEFYIKLGQPVEIAEKLKSLSRIISETDIVDNALYIDVSCPGHEAWKSKPNSPAAPPKGNKNGATL